MRLLAEAEAATNVLPMAPIWYPIIALAIFAASLIVTFSFRNAANRHNPAAMHPVHSLPANTHGQESIDSADPHRL